MNPGQRRGCLFGGELELDYGEVPLRPRGVVDQVQVGPRQGQALLDGLGFHEDRGSVGYLALKEEKRSNIHFDQDILDFSTATIFFDKRKILTAISFTERVEI